jgi:putative ABC transport system permease protein
MNYLRIAFRNILKRKGYALLNITGLTIGMTCCLLIFHHVSYERSYDKFETASNRIVRVRLDSYQKGVLAYKSATSYPAIGPAMKKDFPEVENYCRLFDANLLLSYESQNKKFNEEKGYYADATSIGMFNLQFIKGNPENALVGPEKIILDETTAKKYFGNEEPLGKTLLNRNGDRTEAYIVSGVYKDFPENSHLIIKYLVSYSTLGKEFSAMGDKSNATETGWGWYDFYEYIQLKPNVDYKMLEEKLPAFIDRYVNSTEDNKKANERDELHLIPLSDIHLYSNYNQEAEVNGNGQAVSFLLLIAMFIICIAWINYINLATARSVERAREVGVRKVLGAMRSTLIQQFLVESLLLNCISLVISLSAFFLLLHSFDKFIGKDHLTSVTLTTEYWILFSIMFWIGTLSSGIYPAFVLSGFKPVNVLKGAFKNTGSGSMLRKSLIIVQFVTSVVLIAGTIIVYRQVNYMRKQDLGADITQILILKGPKTLPDSIYQNTYQPFKLSVLQHPSIKGLTSSTSVLGNEIYWTNSSKRLDAENETPVTLYNLGIDFDFIPVYKIKIIAGRNFSTAFTSDNKSVLLNKNGVSLLGFKDAASAINKKILYANQDTLTIIGVTNNFHQLGLQKIIDPMLIRLRPNASRFYSIKYIPGQAKKTLSNLKSIWSEYFPNDPFSYFFLDESYGQQYKDDMLFETVFGIFAFLAILIACFGLLGLSAYNVLQRTKEIGIRKVLGASVKNILLLLSKDFLKLIFLSMFIAVPLGWFVMNKWLEGYAFRIGITWWVFVLAGMGALTIAIITIFFQAAKASMSNPITSLRSE